jgi:orotate phosphoribosyltransferase
LVIEDLAFTATSLIHAAENLRDAGYNVEHALTILSYETPTARDRTAAAHIAHRALTSIDDALEAASCQGALDREQVTTVVGWLGGLRNSGQAA